MKVLHTDGTSYELKDKSLESMQSVVQGYIEIVRVYDEEYPNHILVVNDFIPPEKRNNFFANRYASQLAKQNIYGTVILAEDNEIE